MGRELYKIVHKKYYIAMLLLLLLPALFGIGCFFGLSYIIEEGDITGGALGYCAQIQQMIKFFYFFTIIFLACDAFSGEIETGQLRTVMLHVSSRKRIILQKYTSFCLVVLIFQVTLWVFNAIAYCLSNMKNHRQIKLADKNIVVYVGVFWGYLEAFFICVAVAFLMGIFFRKVYCLVLVYLMWLALRYIDQVADMKSISAEFMADYLNSSHNAVSLRNMPCYFIGVFLCALTIYIAVYFYQHKDIN